MALDELAATIEQIKARITNHGDSIAEKEARTRQVLIDPLLVALGWDVTDPTQVELEFEAGTGRADYALLGDNGPVAMVEAKRLTEPLEKHIMQVLNYANLLGINYIVITDGEVWQMYDVFRQAPLSDRLVMELRIRSLPTHVNALKALSLWRRNLGSGEEPTVANDPKLVKISGQDSSQNDGATGIGPKLDGNPIGPSGHSLINLSVNSGDKPPSMTAIGANLVDLTGYKNWTGYLVGFAKWLIASGNLDSSKCPITIHANSDLYLIADKPEHPSGSEFHSGEKIGGGLWINKNLSTPNKRRSLIHLLESCGIDPNSVRVKVD